MFLNSKSVKIKYQGVHRFIGTIVRVPTEITRNKSYVLQLYVEIINIVCQLFVEEFMYS